MERISYRQIIDKFWPRGIAWPRDPNTLQGKLRAALTPEMERVEQRIQELLDELDPRTSVELLPDWERMLGLPDNCRGIIPSTLEQRRQAVITGQIQFLVVVHCNIAKAGHFLQTVA